MAGLAMGIGRASEDNTRRTLRKFHPDYAQGHTDIGCDGLRARCFCPECSALRLSGRGFLARAIVPGYDAAGKPARCRVASVIFIPVTRATLNPTTSEYLR